MSHYEAWPVRGYNNPGFRGRPLVLVAHQGPHAATDRPDGPRKPSFYCLPDKMTVGHNMNNTGVYVGASSINVINNIGTGVGKGLDIQIVMELRGI
jgi:hypothetical protein